MAATAICLQSRRNTSITLIRNPSPVQLFSSSSIPEPPNNAEDETTSPPQSQPHPSISSYFDDVKSSLRQKQQQQQQSPFQRSDFPSQRQQSPSSQFSNRVPPTVAPSFEEIRKNLSEFRSRTAAPPPPGVNSPSSFPSSPRPTQTVSFQELYKKSTMSRGDVPNNTDSTAPGGKLSYDMIRESIKHLRKNNSNDLNRGNESAHRSRLTDNLFGTEKSTPVYGGTDLSRDKVFGKENNKKTEGQSGEMKTKFLRMYTYDDLGQKLKMLRPEETEKKTGFSLKELSERLIKLRELEEKESEEKQPDSRFSSMKDIRETLVKLSSQENDKKKLSVHRIDILGQLGGTPNYMLSPPKESLVEKYFHPDNMSSAEKMKIELQKVRDEFKMSESDCGSTRVQVAQLTTKIKYLSTTLHKKDKHSRKGLVAMVQQRKKLLKYLRRTDWDSYCLVLDKLGLRDNPDHKN